MEGSKGGASSEAVEALMEVAMARRSLGVSVTRCGSEPAFLGSDMVPRQSNRGTLKRVVH